MPELPEVETTRRGIEPHIVGKTVTSLLVRDSRLRWPIPENLGSILTNKKLQAIDRRGKYLLMQFAHGHGLLHMGMSGSLRIVEATAPVQKHDHFDMIFGAENILRYSDPRRFGALLWTADPIAEHPLLAHLGPEPLADDFDAEYLFKRSRKRKQSIKLFVMDSKVVVGVGNIYANEALFDAGIRPTKAAGKLSRIESVKLIQSIKKILKRAIKQGGTTLRDFVGGDGKPGYFKQELAVYGRGGEACKTCTKPLKELHLAGRATVYCTACQS